MLKKALILLGSTIAVLLGAAWIGLKVKPKPFPARPEQTPEFETVPLPADLPDPVARFYGTIMGDSVPVIESAIITGRGTVRFSGLAIPARLRFTYVAGHDYRHYIEATIFGQPLMKINETFLEGNARLELPFGVVENEPKVNAAANLGLWAESMWLPSIYLTDPRVRWVAIDATTVRLVVPFDDEEDAFTVTFDPETGLIRTLEAMRYKDAADEEKTLWRNEVLEWRSVHGILLPVSATVTWMDDGVPWLEVLVEEVVYNAAVSTYVRASGP